MDEQLRVRAAPFVDGLVAVAYDKQVAVEAAQGGEQPPLRLRAVLDLVHHHILELLLPLLAHGGEILQNVKREEQQVVEIQREIALLAENHLAEERGSARRLCREDKILDIRSRGLELGQLFHIIADDPAPALHAAFLQHFLHQRLHIFFIEDDEILRVAQPVDLFPEELDAEAVDCRNEIARRPARAQRPDPRLHLLGGLVGEGNAQNVGLGHAHHVGNE